MKIVKEFRWEMGHRLPHHRGLCKNVHGHSYRMILEIDGEVGTDGMVIDFFNLDKIVKPVINKYDHAFLCSENDSMMARFLQKENMKKVKVNYQSTVENICSDLLDQIHKKLKKANIDNIEHLSIKLYETPNAFAEKSIAF